MHCESQSKRRQIRIKEQNEHIAERIKLARSSVDMKANIKDYLKNRELCRRISRFPWILRQPRTLAINTEPDRLEEMA
jgi:guanylate kinase